MRPPPEYRRQKSPEELAAQYPADALGDVQAGRAPRAPPDPDGPAPRPPARLGPLATLLLRALQEARAPVTAAELAAHVGAPLLHVAAALNALARSGRVLLLRGDGQGLRYWLQGYSPRGRRARR
jgi:hypothetical protein